MIKHEISYQEEYQWIQVAAQSHDDNKNPTNYYGLIGNFYFTKGYGIIFSDHEKVNNTIRRNKEKVNEKGFTCFEETKYNTLDEWKMAIESLLETKCTREWNKINKLHTIKLAKIEAVNNLPKIYFVTIDFKYPETFIVKSKPTEEQIANKIIELAKTGWINENGKVKKVNDRVYQISGKCGSMSRTVTLNVTIEDRPCYDVLM